MSNSSTFNSGTAENAHDVYVIIQNGENSVVAAKLNLSSQDAAYYKSHAVLSDQALDPQKLDGLGMQGVDSGATYFAHPDFIEAVQYDYNVATQFAVDSHNGLSVELGGYEDVLVSPESLQDLVADHNEIQNWEATARSLESLLNHYDTGKSGSSYELNSKADDVRSALETLQTSGALAQETYDVSNDLGGSNNYKSVDFERLQFDGANPAVVNDLILN